jgi:sugar phosphate isomerase/epimerase
MVELKLENKNSWRLGFVGFIYTPPKEITDRLESMKWHMTKTRELGGGAAQFGMPMDWDQKTIDAIKEHMAKTDVELELGAPLFTMSGGSLLNEGKREVRAVIDAQIKAAHALGVKILRGAYGRLVAEYSRFNKAVPVKDHMKKVIDMLKEVAKIFEGEGVYFAIENHCDFTGKEFAEIFSTVNSKHIGCTLDTANGYTVYCDPNEDVEYLAEYAFTTHIKDMLVQDFKSDYGLIPFQARGCAVGEGNVDIPRALELLDKKSPFAKGLHVVIEQGWMNYDAVTDREAYDKACVHKGLDYLKKMLGRA